MLSSCCVKGVLPTSAERVLAQARATADFVKTAASNRHVQDRDLQRGLWLLGDLRQGVDGWRWLWSCCIGHCRGGKWCRRLERGERRKGESRETSSTACRCVQMHAAWTYVDPRLVSGALPGPCVDASFLRAFYLLEVGALVGLVPAVFTFGLSIPIGGQARNIFAFLCKVSAHPNAEVPLWVALPASLLVELPDAQRFPEMQGDAQESETWKVNRSHKAGCSLGFAGREQAA